MADRLGEVVPARRASRPLVVLGQARHAQEGDAQVVHLRRRQLLLLDDPVEHGRDRAVEATELLFVLVAIQPVVVAEPSVEVAEGEREQR